VTGTNQLGAMPEGQWDALQQALGLKPDPQKLAAELGQARSALADREARLREQAVENAVLRSAARYGASAAQLTDSKTFMDQVSRLDPSSVDFEDDLAAAIKGAAESPRFRAPSAAQAGNGHPAAAGTTAGSRQWTEADVAALPRNREGARRLQEAIDAGLLADLGHPPFRHRGY
jgi:hypothetical protein